MGKTIITVATTGAWPSKEDNPNIPLTPQEIAEDVFDCYQAGASIAHLHMRDDEGLGTMDKKRFAQAVHLIRQSCDIVLNLTTSGDLRATDEERMAHLIELKPQLASFDAGSMNWMNSSVFLNSPAFLERLGNVMAQNGIKPEIEIFDIGMINNAKYYLKKGVLKSPAHFQLVLGAAGGAEATVDNLLHLRRLLPQDATWSALGIGKGHMPIMLATIALGGHLRVGMEDNIYYGPDQLAESNTQLVKRAAHLVAISGGEVATVSDTCSILGLH
ncbi:MAG: 3-keto-5-aminohexanoate cleavage protein [Firmicutes bacterium]|nr:3-keto-5-aminohexanoate cleavage protein [Bacillota bacterium]